MDIYECLSAIVISSGEEFYEKLKFIYRLFDFNQNELIEIDELNQTLQSTIRSICKLVEVNPPSKEEIEFYSHSIFDAIDDDHNNTISYEEFETWIDVQFEL